MVGEKKRTVSESEEEYQAVLVDIEGTTSSISFIKDELFPYVREFLKKHVDEKWETDEFKEDFAKLKEQAKEDETNKVEGFIPIKEDSMEEAKESLIKNVLWQMDHDRKTGALKSLQGHMWKAAHKPLKGHVYDDVPPVFKEWTDGGRKIYVYSSGSVEAQKLLFGNSIHGDLTKYLSNYFDTNVGPKHAENSYKKILEEIKLEPSKVLFLTDVVKEAEAAKKAGLTTAIVIRKGNAEISDDEKKTFKTVNSFSELSFSKNIPKRQKLEETKEENKIVTPKEKVTTVTETAEEPMDTTEETTTVVEKKKDKIKNDVELGSSVDKVNEKKETLDCNIEEKADKSEETEKKEKDLETEKVEDKSVVEKEQFEKEIKDEKEKNTTAIESEKSKFEDEGKSETEEIKENGETKINEESENKENIRNTEDVPKKKLESEVELEEEAKETNGTETKEKSMSNEESEKENSVVTSNGEKLHSNGVIEEGKQNGDTKDTIKIKTVDTATDPEVVTPSVAVA